MGWERYTKDEVIQMVEATGEYEWKIVATVGRWRRDSGFNEFEVAGEVIYDALRRPCPYRSDAIIGLGGTYVEVNRQWYGKYLFMQVFRDWQKKTGKSLLDFVGLGGTYWKKSSKKKKGQEVDLTKFEGQ